MGGATNAESLRLEQEAKRELNWKRWGPYLAERQWGTVREDYSANGDCWNYFSHDQARSRAYRWGEDGLLGITDRECRVCFALGLWNGKDPILKERLFGVTNGEGNHGEDVKEDYFYLDSTPTHSYMKALYKYPQRAFPYAQILEENRRRTRHDPEYELSDTGVFDDGRYFDVTAEYAKATPNDILVRVTVANRGPDPATIHVLPTLWFRNTWSWGHVAEVSTEPAWLRSAGTLAIKGRHPSLGDMRLSIDGDHGQPQLLFTENETNFERLFGHRNVRPHVKDAFHRFVVHGERKAVNPEQIGSKAAAHFVLKVPAGGEYVLKLRLTVAEDRPLPRGVVGASVGGRDAFADFDKVFAARIREADEFYQAHMLNAATPDQRNVKRQAFAGLLWSKQYYHYAVTDWLNGDANQPPPPEQRKNGRNRDWAHLFNRDVISMPDKWEYPWYAAWDLAFHMIPMARIDPEFAKQQLLLFLREWFMHPNGQLPAYEFAFDDVNPPVHAWACWRVYKITGQPGRRDLAFLARAFQKLLINFTWWVNRKDVAGKHIFAGGFLGLDNIGLFDRSKPLPTGRHLEQADGTAWMAFYCATMLSMALELAAHDPVYEDVASKFFEHFVAIADAMNTLGGTGLWDEADGFYYDELHIGQEAMSLRLRSMVGLIPLFAVEILDEKLLARLPGFRKRMQWFLDHRKDLARHISYLDHRAALAVENGALKTAVSGSGAGCYLLAIPSRERLERVLTYLLDESEFLSPYGVRSLSAVHREHPFEMTLDGAEYCAQYTPGESNTDLFGGNSNWRGPIWFPLNYLLIEALERYHYYYRDTLLVEFPTGSENMLNLSQVAAELAKRLSNIFLKDGAGRRPCHGDERRFHEDEHYRELLLFHEYFHGDTGRGVGASHQTGWTALVTRLMETCEQK